MISHNFGCDKRYGKKRPVGRLMTALGAISGEPTPAVATHHYRSGGEHIQPTAASSPATLCIGRSRGPPLVVQISSAHFHDFASLSISEKRAPAVNRLSGQPMQASRTPHADRIRALIPSWLAALTKNLSNEATYM